MAIDFEGMDIDSFNTLREIVAYNLGDGERVRKEVLEYLQTQLASKSP